MNASTSVTVKQSPGGNRKRKKGQIPGDLEVGLRLSNCSELDIYIHA